MPAFCLALFVRLAGVFNSVSSPFPLDLSGGYTPGSTGALAEMPTFTPSSGPSGLDILAAAASSATAGSVAVYSKPVTPNLNQPGPYNPAAALAPKIAKRILDLEFVDISEVTTDAAPEPSVTRPFPVSRPPITSISQWTERFAVMAALLVTRFPLKAPELFAYLAAVVRAERNYEVGRWVAYDRQFRREALARKSLDWSVPDPRLYSEAFTGRAKSIPRCSVCLQDDHLTQRCPQNPDNSWWGWPVGPGHWTAPSPGQAFGGPRHPRRPREVCRRFNEGLCRLPTCRFIHTCSACNGDHAAIHCNKGHQRDRSPSRMLTAQPRFNQSGPRY